jgi:hypothetical protein
MRSAFTSTGFALLLAAASWAGEVDPAKAAEAKFADAIRASLRAKDLERAIAKAEECVTGLRRAPSCHLLAGRAYTQRAGRQNHDDLEQARRHFEKFVEQADPSDPELAGVRKLLAPPARRKK